MPWEQTATEIRHRVRDPNDFEIERLAAHFEGAVNREDRTARLVFYSGAPVRRQGPGGAYDLRFSMDPANVRLGRLNDGAPLLNSHRDFTVDDVIGVVEKAWLEGGRGVAQVRFSKRTDVDPIWQDVQDGILKNASMGVAIYKLVDITKDGDQVKQMLATDWEPEEVSLVPIGADPGAGFKGRKREVQMQKNETMIGGGSSVDPAAEIRRIVLAARLPKDFAEGLVAAGATIEQARSAVLDKLAAESERVPIRSHSAVVTRDYRETLAERMAEALACRYTGKAPSEAAREFVGVPVHELARECLVARGVAITTRRPAELIRLALHTTSDFPNLLSGSGQRMLLDAYRAAEPAIKRVARKSTARDFREKAVLRLGEMPQLLKVNEGGEIAHGTRAESKQAYRLYTYARIFGITRQALVNDDLGAFADFARAYGVAAAALEGKLLSELLTSNPVMSDGIQLFHNSHGNVTSGTGSALGVSGLSAARKAMRLQKGLDGETVLDIAPAFLVVPAALETSGQQLLTSTTYPTAVDDANPFAGQLSLVVDPRLDTDSETAWYLFASPDLAPVLEYSYLEGQEGPMADFREGFEVDGIQWRCRLDFGCGALDWRGAHRATGA